MFENLSQRLARVVKTMRGEARLTEANTQEMLREIRIALLEADVALPVVRDFVGRVREKALGQEVVGSLSPGQALVGVVHRELTELMGGATAELNLATQPPAIVLMAGLQGAGKTTTVGKLAKRLREQKKKVLTVSCDVYRPAAIEQLRTVTQQAGADFFPSTPDQAPVDIARAAVQWAALSVKAVTGCPIKFVGVGEKLAGLDAFHPDRMANRILGMGDIVALVEQAQANVDEKAAKELADKLKSGNRFDLNDFLQQISQMKKMGGLSSLLDKLPAQFQAAAGQADMAKAEKDIRRMQGIIHSMTPRERARPELIKAGRKRRIAAGAGVQVQDVNRMLSQFDQMQAVMKKMQKGGLAKMMRGMKGMMPGGMR